MVRKYWIHIGTCVVTWGLFCATAGASTLTPTPAATAAETAVAGQEVSADILVRLDSTATPDMVLTQLHEAGETTATYNPTLHAIEVADPGESVTEISVHIADVEGVAAVETDDQLVAYDLTPNDPAFGTQWGLTQAGFPALWGAVPNASTQVIAILDTGVTPIPELATVLLPGIDLINNDNDPTDDNGHGTKVAALAGARGNDGVSVAGGCWDCKILPVKVLGNNGVGSESVVATGIRWAVDNGATVLNLSLGTLQRSMVVADAVRYAISRNVSVVAAAGNDGVGAPHFPAAERSVIGVGAHNEQGLRYAFSDYGSWVKISSPGANVAVDSAGSQVQFAGTSSASPLVAASVAMLRTLRGDLNVVGVCSLLVRSTSPLPGQSANMVPFPTNQNRGGILALGRAVAMAASATNEVITGEEQWVQILTLVAYINPSYFNLSELFYLMILQEVVNLRHPCNDLFAM